MKKIFFALMILCLASSMLFSIQPACADETSGFVEMVRDAKTYFVSFELIGEAYGDEVVFTGTIIFCRPDFVRIEMWGRYSKEPKYLLITRASTGNLMIIDNGDISILSDEEAEKSGYALIAANPLYKLITDEGASINVRGNMLAINVDSEKENTLYLVQINYLDAGGNAGSSEGNEGSDAGSDAGSNPEGSSKAEKEE